MVLVLHEAVVLLVHVLVSGLAHRRQVSHFFLADHVAHARTPGEDKGSFISAGSYFIRSRGKCFNNKKKKPIQIPDKDTEDVLGLKQKNLPSVWNDPSKHYKYEKIMTTGNEKKTCHELWPMLKQNKCMTEQKRSFTTGGTKLCSMNGIQLMGKKITHQQILHYCLPS